MSKDNKNNRNKRNKQFKDRYITLQKELYNSFESKSSNRTNTMVTIVRTKSYGHRNKQKKSTSKIIIRGENKP